MKKILLIVLLSLSQLPASDAFRGSLEFTQDDNVTKFTGKLKGDEWFNYIEQNSTGSIVVYDGNNYVYAEVNNSKLAPTAQLVGQGTAPAAIDAQTLASLANMARHDALDKMEEERLKGILVNKVWYEVVLGRNPTTGQLQAKIDSYAISTEQNGSYISVNFTPLLPNSGNSTTPYSEIIAKELRVENGNSMLIKTFTQGPGYLKVKNYEQISVDTEFINESRWYDNNASAISYYNTLPQ